MDIVVDASTTLSAYMPDESTPQAQQLMRDYALGTVDLWAPKLLLLELLNAYFTSVSKAREVSLPKISTTFTRTR